MRAELRVSMWQLALRDQGKTTNEWVSQPCWKTETALRLAGVARNVGLAGADDFRGAQAPLASQYRLKVQRGAVVGARVGQHRPQDRGGRVQARRCKAPEPGQCRHRAVR